MGDAAYIVSRARGKILPKKPVSFCFYTSFEVYFLRKMGQKLGFAPLGGATDVRCTGVCMSDMHEGVHP